MLTKCWANTGKCRANSGQMQDIRQANGGQMSDKCRASAGQMTAKYWASAGQMTAKCQANARQFFFQNWAMWLFVYPKYENRKITLKKLREERRRICLIPAEIKTIFSYYSSKNDCNSKSLLRKFA